MHSFLQIVRIGPTNDFTSHPLPFNLGNYLSHFVLSMKLLKPSDVYWFLTSVRLYSSKIKSHKSSRFLPGVFGMTLKTKYHSTLPKRYCPTPRCRMWSSSGSMFQIDKKTNAAKIPWSLPMYSARNYSADRSCVFHPELAEKIVGRSRLGPFFVARTKVAA